MHTINGWDWNLYFFFRRTDISCLDILLIIYLNIPIFILVFENSNNEYVVQIACSNFEYSNKVLKYFNIYCSIRIFKYLI